MKPYYELASFKGIYLEDSYVLNCAENAATVVFTIEFVLNESNPQYTLPKEGEQYCYKKGQLIFPEVEKVIWRDKSFHKITDAAGEIDYGNIDSFIIDDNGLYHLTGEWGEVIIKSAQPSIELDC